MSYILPPGLCLVRSIPVAEAKAIAAAEKEAAKAKEEAAVKAAKAKETARGKAAKSKAVAKEKAAITKAEGIAARKVAKATEGLWPRRPRQLVQLRGGRPGLTPRPR